METSNQSIVPPPVHPGFGSRFLARIKITILILIIVGLLISNVLSLIDDAFHSAAYGLVGGILGSALVMKAADLLKNSPTIKRRTDVQRMTAKVMAEKQALQVAKVGAEARHAALMKSHQAIEAEKAVVTKARDELQQKAAQRTVATKAFAAKVSARTVKNASRNLSGMAGEAIPYIGVGVLVGITTLEIMDACDTLKDVNELKAAFDLGKEDESKVCGMKVPSKDEVLASVKANWQAAYKTAVDSINQAGKSIMSIKPPSLSWWQIRDLAGAVVGRAEK